MPSASLNFFVRRLLPTPSVSVTAPPSPRPIQCFRDHSARQHLAWICWVRNSTAATSQKRGRRCSAQVGILRLRSLVGSRCDVPRPCNRNKFFFSPHWVCAGGRTKENY